ncbi:AMP-binding protein, partial [Vibrio cholerae]|uniref:AMP-binding protein n=1 Tax=Vibrio cholerae TaxID=666 RepID=UPI0015A06345
AEDWTYGDVHRRATALAHALRDRGVARGDRVAYLGLNSPSFIVTMFAVAKLGAVTVPLNTRLAAPETAYILRDSGAGLLIWDAGFEQITGSEEVTG